MSTGICYHARMNKHTVITWLKAARPHTMGLSFAVILAGACQIGWEQLRWDILLLSLLASGGFQAVSNFANDYGDFTKGTDVHRPESYRALSAGNLNIQQVKIAIITIAMFSLCCVVLLVWRSPVSTSGKWLMFCLGILSVLAAIGYTMGKRPYGYYALGDIMVFLFFGLVGVVGSYYLQGGTLGQMGIWLVALAFGAFSTTVLNINNIRDCDKDKHNHKTTIANLLGKQTAHRYQRGLFALALAALFLYGLTTHGLGLFPASVAVWCVWLIDRTLITADNHSDYNHCLAMTVKYTLLLSVPTAIVGLFA